MANALYPKAKESFLKGEISILSDTISITLIDTGQYTYSASHQFRSDVPNAAVISTTNLSDKTAANGIFDAADGTLS